MGHPLDAVPESGIARIRDLMLAIDRPFRLDQGDVSFDVPDAVKEAIRRAVAENRTHYLPTLGLPPLRERLMEKVRTRNELPVRGVDEVFVTAGGMHGLFITCQALLNAGDEVIVPDPEWPPVVGNVTAAQGVAVPCPLHERLGWRYNLDELEGRITRRTRAIYVNSPHNPTGSILRRADLERIAEIASRHDLRLIADEAYEDIVYDSAEHVSLGSLPGLHERTISLFTFSKSFAMTGLRLGYVVVRDPELRRRMAKVLYYSSSNVSSLVQHAGVGALEAGAEVIRGFRDELAARRDLFFSGIDQLGGHVLKGTPPEGAFYAFLRIDDGWTAGAEDEEGSRCWRFAKHLITGAKIGSVPGAEFGANGAGYVRFCFARGREELDGALSALGRLLGS